MSCCRSSSLFSVKNCNTNTHEAAKLRPKWNRSWWLQVSLPDRVDDGGTDLEDNVFQVLHVGDGGLALLVALLAADLLLENLGLLREPHHRRLALIQQLNKLQ